MNYFRSLLHLSPQVEHNYTQKYYPVPFGMMSHSYQLCIVRGLCFGSPPFKHRHMNRRKEYLGQIIPDSDLFLEHIDVTGKLGLFPQCAFQDERPVYKDNFK